MTQEDRQRYSSAAGSAGLQASGAGTAKKSDILPARPWDAPSPPPNPVIPRHLYESMQTSARLPPMTLAPGELYDIVLRSAV